MSKASDTTGNFSLITEGNQQFLIMQQPKDATLNNYYINFGKYNVKHVVRVCPETTYDTKELISRGIDCHAFPYADGSPPPDDVVEPWLALCQQNLADNNNFVKNNAEKSTIAIHCVAGLGRAPVLVAIALIDQGMSTISATELIRKERRGAINKPQVDFLKAYEKERGSGVCDCVLQ